jgi:hypothetical protein
MPGSTEARGGPPSRSGMRPAIREERRGELAIAWLIAGIAVGLQMATNGRYGYFRDELYFLAAGDHLAWGYVDFAPLVALLARASRALLGDSLHAIRLLPALAQGAEIVLTGLIARELGGRRFAVFLSCACVLAAPVILGNATRLSMNPFEPLFWMGCVYFLLRALRAPAGQGGIEAGAPGGGAPGGGEPRALLACGLLAGLGLENKHSTAFFLLSLAAGLLLTPDRHLLRSKWLWAALGIAAAVFLPNVIWQVQHHFPTLEDLRNVKATHKNIELAPPAFLVQQVMMLNPASALVWVAGLGFLLFDRAGKRWRSLGVTYLVFLALLAVLHAKDYYLAPIYPMLFAAGGVAWERWTAARAGLRRVRVALPAAVLALGLVALPLVVPLLPVERIGPYMTALGMKMTRTEVHHSGPLPQHFGDEFGWPELAAAVASVYHALPPAERARTALLAGNYGEAGAIDFFGARHGLPKAISAHQNYYYWGPREYTGESLILTQWEPESARRWCREVREGPTLAPPWGMAEEHYTILLCRGLKMPLAQAWPRLKVWN